MTNFLHLMRCFVVVLVLISYLFYLFYFFPDLAVLVFVALNRLDLYLFGSEDLLDKTKTQGLFLLGFHCAAAFIVGKSARGRTHSESLHGALRGSERLSFFL